MVFPRPLVAALVFVAALLLVGSGSLSDGDPVAEHVVRLTNEERNAQGLPALETDAGLVDLACRHSEDMIARDFFAHDNPDGETPFDRAAQTHRRLIGSFGENIWGRTGGAGASPQDLAARIVDAWMNSPGHRANILRATFTHVGVCVATEGRVTRVTQSFADARGFFHAPLPRRAAVGDSMDVTVQPYPASASGPAAYEWVTVPGGSAVSPVSRPNAPGTPFRGALRTPSTPGRYEVRFFFSKPSEQADVTRYSVVKGPRLTVTE